MKKTFRDVLHQLNRTGAYLTRAKYSRLWFVGRPGCKEADCMHVQDRVVQEMRGAGLVVMRDFHGMQMLGLPEKAGTEA